MRTSIATLWGIGLGLLVYASISISAVGKVNFSGTWALDKSQSDFQQLPGMRGGAGNAQDASLSMVIDQQGTTLKVTRTFKAGVEENTETHVYKTDGSETTNTGFRGESAVTKASWDGDKLVVNSTRTMKVMMQDVTVQSRFVWSLSPDGKTLTLNGTVDAPRGEQHVKAVFHKR